MIDGTVSLVANYTQCMRAFLSIIADDGVEDAYTVVSLYAEIQSQ